MEEFDYLVLGGGSAGCTVALARLSENPAISVALFEAGDDGKSWMIWTPMGAVAMIPRPIRNWAYETVPQPGLNGRKGYQPRGKTLGGSSAINAMVYIRGHRWDYDHWAELGNPGWSFPDVLPYFKRAENNEQFHDSLHGQGGPLNVAKLRTDNPLQDVFLDAAREAQFPIVEDFNGPEQEGCGVYQVTQINGERCSAARAYIHPHLGNRANLALKTGAQIRKILFEGTRAVGAEVSIGGKVQTFRARREVILSAGAFGSPQILQLSGVGAGADLQKLGIPVIVDRAGVGANLQDHPDFIFGYRTESPHSVGYSLGGFGRFFGQIKQYRAERRGMVSTNFAECGAFLRTQRDLPAPDIQLHFVIALVDDHARKSHWGHGLSCHVCALRPYARGSVRLASPDPSAAPLIDPNFLGDERDVRTMIDGWRMTKRIMDAPSMRRTWTKELYTAGVERDDDIRALLREKVDTVYHPVGTCMMGPDPATAVVDAQLRVHGVQGLRVVDASIMPTLIGGNTNAPSIMIGEKAADMIRAA